MNTGKEVDCYATSHIFTAIASLLKSAGEYYEAGQPEKGETIISSATNLMSTVGDLAE